VVQQQLPDAVLLDINMDDLNGWQTAQLMRGVAPTLPILLVSADPFENRPELLAAVGARGFVNKPVIESELLDLLARVLQLEWVHEAQRVEAQPLATQATAGALPLPEELRERLIALARQGNASGLRGLLRGHAEQVPALAETLQVLVAYVDRFDFHALIARLRETEDDSPV
jgi:CheY-like chemotaxis protein